MANGWVVASGIGGFAGVGLGAAGTHLTNGDVHAANLISTAANFLLFHSLALLGIAALASTASSRTLTTVGYLFGIGMTIFAGGLTALALDSDFTALWIIPVGGSMMLCGWLALTLFGIFAVRS